MRLSDLQKRVIASKFSLLLDTFPNAAAAYSLRKLRSAYTGNCIEVRRSSDNALQDIGFVNNELDTASLLSFVGAGDGFVRTWYDQSLIAANVTRTTNANQPQIVSNGNLIIEGSQPCILFDGVEDSLQSASTHLDVGGEMSVFIVVNGAYRNEDYFGWRQANNGFIYSYRENLFGVVNSYLSANVGRNTIIRTRLPLYNIGITIRDSSNNFVAFDINNFAFTSTSGTVGYLSSNIPLFIGENGRTDAAKLFSNIKIQELVIYQDNKINDKDVIKNQLNSYYNVFI